MVAAGGKRQFMHKTLRRENLGTIARRAPRAGWNLQRKHRRGAAQVRRLDRVFQIVGEVGAGGFLFAVGGEGDEMLLPGVEPAVGIDRPLQLMVAGRTVEVVPEIVFPGPLQFDWSVDSLRDGRGLAGIV